MYLFFLGLDTTTYDIWSFVLLIAEPFLRPTIWILFYFKYLKDDPSNRLNVSNISKIVNQIRQKYFELNIVIAMPLPWLWLSIVVESEDT